MLDTNRLTQIEEIRLLKARYIRLADTKDWAALEQCFYEDFVGNWRSEAMSIIKQALKDIPFAHHETFQRIDGAWTIKSLRLTRLKVETFSSVVN